MGSLHRYQKTSGTRITLNEFIFTGDKKSTMNDIREEVKEMFGGDYLDRMIERARLVKGSPKTRWQLNIAPDNLNRAIRHRVVR